MVRVQLHLLDPFIQCDTAKPLFPTGFALGFLSLVSGAPRRQVMDPGLWLPSPVTTSPPFHSCWPSSLHRRPLARPARWPAHSLAQASLTRKTWVSHSREWDSTRWSHHLPWVPRGFWTGLHFEAHTCSHCLTIILENEHTKTNVLRLSIPMKCVHYS